MKRNPVLLTVLTLFFQGLATFAQQPSAPPPPITSAPQTVTPAADDDDVVRITTNLIQFDVTVTDHDGHPIPDLRPEDFEILENDKTQTIANFSYIALGANPTPAPAKPVDKNAPPVPPVPLRPDQVRRTIALVVDDLGLSFESMARVRDALKKFVEQQMQPGDLVAIIRTGSGVGALQQFTTDKRQLVLAIDQVRWRAIGRGNVDVFSPLTSGDVAATGKSPGATIDDADANEFREQLYAVGTLGALNYVVRGLRDLPGRKSVVLMSDGFALQNNSGAQYQRTYDALLRLTDLANRASVVFYTMDARGLMPTGLTAADDMSSRDPFGSMANDPRRFSNTIFGRSLQIFNTQGGLKYLADKTGGFAFRNNNDLTQGLKRIVADQNGYYLIGYHPDESTFDPKRLRYNSFKVKLKRKGLELRYRNGFFGISDDKAKEAPAQNRGRMLADALMSPFNAGEAQLQLTALFGNDAQAGSYVRSFLHIRTQDLTFTDLPDGGHRAVFDLLTVMFGNNGAPIDQVSRTYAVELRREAYDRALKAGFVYTAAVPIKKPGAYQLRIAVRDTQSNRIGSASQFIEVPDLKKNRLFLSGVVAFGVAHDPRKIGTVEANGADPETDPEAGAATRRFLSGMAMQYACYIYNAQIDKAASQPQLQTQIRIFRDGQEVFTGNRTNYDPNGQADLLRLPFHGGLVLGSAMEPGSYVLQIVVTDALAKEKQRTATQWIDFEIVPPANPKN